MTQMKADGVTPYEDAVAAPPTKPHRELAQLAGLLAPTLALGRLVGAAEAFLSTWEDPSVEHTNLGAAHRAFRAALDDAKGTVDELGA